jgi:hypothetical protein
MKRVTPGTRAAALALSSLLVLTGCSGGDDAEQDPQSDATSPAEGTESPTDEETGGPTEPGTELELQESAVFEWQPNQNKDASTVELSVNSIDKGTQKDLRAIEVNPEPKKPQLYYVRITLENLGGGDLGGHSPISLPLYVNDGSSVLVRPAELLLEFKPCQLQKLPKKFPEGTSADLCLVYLLDGRQLSDVSLVPDLEEDPITWTGEVTPAGGKKKGTKPKASPKPESSPTS